MSQPTFTFTSDPTTDPASVNAYANVPITQVAEGAHDNFFHAITSGPISVNWKNTGANSITVQVLGSNTANAADADKRTVFVGTTIAAAASIHIEIPVAYYQFYWFQQKATVAASQGATNLAGRHARV